MKISKVSTNPVFRTSVFAKIPKDKRLEELETEKRNTYRNVGVTSAIFLAGSGIAYFAKYKKYPAKKALLNSAEAGASAAFIGMLGMQLYDMKNKTERVKSYLNETK